MLWILLLAILGLLDAAYLVSKVHRHQAPVCPLGQSCDFVLKSRYNNMFGVKNELLGLFFYVGVIVAALASLGGYMTIPTWLWQLGLAGGFAVSFILTGIQVFVLRAYCSWCLASAFINLLVLITALRL